MNSTPFQSGEGNNRNQREYDQPEQADQVRTLLTEYPFQIHISDHHTNYHHTRRTDHISKTTDTTVNNRWKPDLQRKKRNSYDHRDHIRITQDFPDIQLLFLSDQFHTMRPHQYRLYQDKCSRIKNPFFSQNSSHQWNHKIPCICINDGCFFNTVKVEYE